MTTQERRRKRHARRLAQGSLSNAGSRTNVADALKRARATVSNECTTRSNPTLRAAFDMMLSLTNHPECSARAFVNAVNEAIELVDIVAADTETLIQRGTWLVEQENRLGALEETAALKTTVEHSAALRVWAEHAIELAAIEDELRYRHIDLLALYREGV